ncbi:hypothetical protein EMPG_14954 [Blastomyces silverae]|uniref:Gamma interferon inducible lysosomal thiol reductase (GILT) n=1 Tax=Blastomyces silverae TaxID=2060906 RepID=A0A0H1BER7_9EURO|nr:hypothetical protein EMPG_14954 [Blastomyces silverae]
MWDAEKRQTAELAPRSSSRRTIYRLFRRSLILSCIALIIFALIRGIHAPSEYIDKFKQTNVGHKTTKSASPLRGNNHKGAPAGRVPLEAHIMSKCPDAEYCLEKLIVPVMAQVHDKVDFRLSFIGSVSNKSSDVSCKHGPAECVGNMLMLCAANLPFPPGSETQNKTPIVRSLGFANCLLASYDKIPERELVEDCALEFGLDFGALNACVSRQVDEDDAKRAGSDDPDKDKVSGLALLRTDFKRSAALGIKKSCTVRVNEKIWCIRDSHEWKDCQPGGDKTSTLVDEINRLYDNSGSS